MRERQLEIVPGAFAIARLDSGAQVPDWAWRGGLASVTRTVDELSIVCEESSIPDDVRAERGFRCLRVHGPLDFSETGVLASIAGPLARASVSIFAVSTYDTDYLLLREADLDCALTALSRAGHIVRK